jgi:hypothetical protein
MGGGCRGFEPSEVCPQFSENLPLMTLQLFVKGITERKGIEKNLCAKKFIKNIPLYLNAN